MNTKTNWLWKTARKAKYVVCVVHPVVTRIDMHSWHYNGYKNGAQCQGSVRWQYIYN